MSPCLGAAPEHVRHSQFCVQAERLSAVRWEGGSERVSGVRAQTQVGIRWLGESSSPHGHAPGHSGGGPGPGGNPPAREK